MHVYFPKFLIRSLKRTVVQNMNTVFEQTDQTVKANWPDTIYNDFL